MEVQHDSANNCRCCMLPPITVHDMEHEHNMYAAECQDLSVLWFLMTSATAKHAKYGLLLSMGQVGEQLVYLSISSFD